MLTEQSTTRLSCKMLLAVTAHFLHESAFSVPAACIEL